MTHHKTNLLRLIEKLIKIRYGHDNIILTLSRTYQTINQKNDKTKNDIL